MADQPHRVGFYPLLRSIDAMHPGWPRLGKAVRPVDEPLRVGQVADMGFAPAPLASLLLDSATPRLHQYIFGLLGPNGPLPRHLSEQVRERALHHADGTLQAFMDLLTHRFALLFYRAWARAQPILDLERPDARGFAARMAAWFGEGLESLRHRDALPEATRLFFTGRLARQVRDADGLAHWVASTFDVPAKVLQWQRHRMPLDPSQRCRLHPGQVKVDATQRIGHGAVLGAVVDDIQHRFRLVLGPLTHSELQAFLPDGKHLPRLLALVRHWVGLEFAWDLQLIAQHRALPRPRLGGAGRVGLDLWLDHPHRKLDPADLVIDVDRFLPERART